MTLPVPVALPPDCRVYIDSVRFADGCTPGEVDTDPVVLTGLDVTWGRDTVLDQPEPSTCTFTVLDIEGGARFLERLHIGAQVDIHANATIYPDPNVPTIVDGGFEAKATGSTPPSVRTNANAVVTTEKAAAGTKSVSITPVSGSKLVRVVFPPAPFGGISAWDSIPRAALGQTWAFSARIWRSSPLVDVQVVSIRPVAFTAPNATSAVLLDPVMPAAGAPNAWQTVSGQVIPPADVWLGVAVEMYPAGASWNAVPAGVTWDSVAAGVRWDDLGRCFVDDLAVSAPAAGGLRAGSVFSGRITDLEARYDLSAGGTMVDVTAQSHLAELGNRYVGSTPFLAETLQSRFSAIVAASGQTVNWTVDPGVQNYVMSWRDVDSQPAARLLQELAQSVAGALWPASSTVTGPYLRLEDINSRAAMYGLQKGGDNIIRIIVAPAVNGKVLYLSACDVLLEPIRMVQSTEDDSTRVALTWREQTTDGQGNQKPTDREMLVVNTARETATGQRRIAVSTQLTNSADGKIVADSMLARASVPGWRIGGLEMHLDKMTELNAATLELIMSILDGSTRPGLALVLTDVPTWTPAGTGDDVALYLEGGHFTFTAGDVGESVHWELELIVSDARAQGKALLRWDDLPQVRAATRTNPAKNPRSVTGGSGTWSGTRGWGTSGNGTYSDLTGISPSPTGNVTTARRKTWTVAATNNAGSGFTVRVDSSNMFLVTAGTTITASCWMRFSGSGTRMFQVILQFFTGTVVGSEGTVVSQPTTTAFSVASGVWTRVSWTGVVPAGANGMAFYPDVAAGGTLWAVGNTLDATAVIVETATVARTNRVLNPQDRTGGAAGWLTTRGFGTGGAGTHTHSQAVAAPGSAPSILTACRKSWTTASTSADQTGLNLAATATDWFSVTAGETITVSAYMRHNSTTAKDFAVYVAFYTGTPMASATVGTSVGAPITTVANTAWARVSYTVVVPAGAAGMRVIADVRSGAGPWAIGEWLDVTGLMIEVASALGSYFEGEAADTESVGYDWTGAAWNSTSTAATLPAYFDGSTADTADLDFAWTGTANSSSSTAKDLQGWSWDQFDPAITWNDLAGVGLAP